MIFVALRLVNDPLITLGDAVESFLNTREETTKNICYMTSSQAVSYLSHRGSRTAASAVATKDPLKGGVWRGVQHFDSLTQVKTLRPVLWYKAASRLQWGLTIGSILIAVTAIFACLSEAIVATSPWGLSIIDLGFGQLQLRAIIKGWAIDYIDNRVARITAAILIANTPQAILSFLYFNLNGLLTSMFTALEWSHFATERKALRVSTPKGQQRSTHFLQLPYKIAIPLMAIFGILHWVLSQSIFLAAVAEYDANGALFRPAAIASCAFSPLAMLVVLVIGLLLLIGCLVIGRLKYDASMPLVGSCSIAISAACHQPDWDVNASLKPVQWGIIPGSDEETGIGHCSFSSGFVEPVQEGREYA